MADKVTICNLALSYLGDSASVASISPPEDTPQAHMCALHYPLARRAMLEMHDWSFAMRRAALPAKVEGTLDDPTPYAVPSDCLRAVRVWSSVNSMPTDLRYRATAMHAAHWGVNPRYEDFVLEGDTLYTQAEAPILEYVSDSVSEARFPTLFAVAMAWYLARDLAGQRVRGDSGQKLARQLDASFQTALSVAKTKDAAQQQHRLDFVPTWIERR